MTTTSQLAAAHISVLARLRMIAAVGVQRAWTGLPEHNEDNVPAFLGAIVPVVIAAQRQAVAATDAYLARALRRQPLGVNPVGLIGAAARGGVSLAVVYRRPFVTVWTALAAGTAFSDAVAQGLQRATTAAATDVQLAMRGTLREVGEADPRIAGYRRVTNPGACELCALAAGQRYRTGQLMPIHPHCGCGVDVITGEPPPPDDDLRVHSDRLTVDVREHGELGPVLVNAAHHFTEP